MHIDSASGICSTATWCASPNFDARPSHCALELIVIHGISLPAKQFSGAAIIDLFCNRLHEKQHPSFAALMDLRVSTHFLIRRRGELWQFVACGDRAWHAGVSIWQERPACNDFSLGIELEGADTLAYTESQYQILAQLIQILRRSYATLSNKAIVGHADIAPGRKTDPGPAFDWQRLAYLL